MKKQRNKLKQSDKNKIMSRFVMKKEEFSKLSLDELKSLWNTTKMSSTDKQALISVVDYKLKEETANKFKELEKNDNIEGE